MSSCLEWAGSCDDAWVRSRGATESVPGATRTRSVGIPSYAAGIVRVVSGRIGRGPNDMAKTMSGLWEVAPEGSGHGRVSLFVWVDVKMTGRPHPPYEEPPDERREALADRQMIKAVGVGVALLLFVLVLMEWL